MLIVVVVIALEPVIAQLTDSMARSSFSIVQAMLPVDTRPPVVVLDIGDLPRDQPIVGKWSELGKVTSRKRLEDIVAAVEHSRPAAIGIDIDFSAEDGGLLMPSDRSFFESVLKLSKISPIFLGVYRSQVATETALRAHSLSARPRHWLGEGRFDALAGSMEDPNDPYQLVRYYDFGDRSRLPTLGAALAESYLREGLSDEEPRAWPSFLAEPDISWDAGRGYSGRQFVVDFSALAALMNAPVPAIDQETIHQEAQRLRGNIVLIGDATLEKASGRDSIELPYPVPGISDWRTPIPGVFYHAISAYSIVHPLYQLTPGTRVVTDFILCFAALGSVLLVRWRFAREPNRDVLVLPLLGFVFILVSLIVCVGAALVHWTRLVWEDWILAVLLLVAHPFIEPLFSAVVRLTKKVFLSTFTAERLPK